MSLSQYSIQYSIAQLVGATAESPSGDYKDYCLAECYTVFRRNRRFGVRFCSFFEDASCLELICVQCTDINESLMGWLCLSHHVLQLTRNW